MERTPDFIINVVRSDLRLCFGEFDLEIGCATEAWILEPMETPPLGCAIVVLDSGEMFAFRPKEGAKNGECMQ